MHFPRLLGLTAALVFLPACADTLAEPQGLDSDELIMSADASDKGKIVFVSPPNPPGGEIYVMNADGSGRTNVTNHPANDTEPSWSRNGKQIVFSSNRRNPGTFMHDIWVMNADGSGLRRVTTTSGQRDQYPHMSPNGKQILFTRGQEPPPFPGAVPQIFKINVDGSGETNLTNNAVPGCFPFGPPPCFFEAWPRWSPNGKQILFNRAPRPGQADIWVMNADGTGKTNLTNRPEINDFFADWSPNGKTITWGGGAGFGNADIFVMNIDGSGLTAVTTDGATNFDVAPVWSPNGKHIAFSSARGGPFQIFTINPDGTGERQLTDGDDGSNGFTSWASGPLPRR